MNAQQKSIVTRLIYKVVIAGLTKLAEKTDNKIDDAIVANVKKVFGE